MRRQPKSVCSRTANTNWLHINADYILSVDTSKESSRRIMIGSYVRIVTSPDITGKIRAARFDKGAGVFLFHPDPQCVDTFPETWLPDSAFEECVPPKHTPAVSNDKPTDLPLKYFRMAVAPYTRVGTIIGARFEGGCVRFLFHQDPRLAYAFPDVWLSETELEPCTRPTDEQISEALEKNSPLEALPHHLGRQASRNVRNSSERRVRESGGPPPN